MPTDRTTRTRVRLLDAAMTLFEEQGYDATTTRQIAEAAGVTQMTFFRHFPTKDAVVVSDPYDPLIAGLVAAQPPDLPLVRRIADGFAQALTAMDDTESRTARRRIAIAATTPALRGALLTGTRATESAVVDARVASGADPTHARVATAATLAAVTTALLAWATHPPETSLRDVVTDALAVLVGDDPAPEEPR